MSRSKSFALRSREPLRIGFLPVTDCAPLVYAYEAGLFARYDLDVELHRASKWSALRDDVIQGKLDAAHAPATLPLLAQLGVESEPCPCVTGLVVSLQGNAITLSRVLWDKGIRSAGELKEEIFRSWGRRTCTFGVISPYSCQHLLLWQWLKGTDAAPSAHLRIVTVPPEQMFPMLKMGYLDGFCAGEPWNSLAVASGFGVCVATSADLAPLHPEKVLMARRTFAEGRPEDHERLIAAILQACAFCNVRENRRTLIGMLAHPHYINSPEEVLGNSFPGDAGALEVRGSRAQDFAVFHGHGANVPDLGKAQWIAEHLKPFVRNLTFPRMPPDFTWDLEGIFRTDIFEGAQRLMSRHAAELACEVQNYNSSQRS